MRLDLCDFIRGFSESLLTVFCVSDLVLVSEDRVVNKVDRLLSSLNRIGKNETNNVSCILFLLNPAMSRLRDLCEGILGESN